MTKAYTLKTPGRDGSPIGTVVFDALEYDYGLAADDTRRTGIAHISVTLKRSGGYPGFTHPAAELDDHMVEPLPALTEEHVSAVCLLGMEETTAAGRCRYITVGASGWKCQKHTLLAQRIDVHVAAGTMVAQGDNCEGRS